MAFPDGKRAVASNAGVVELVDAPDSKSGSERSVGSIPTARTIAVPNLAKVGVEGSNPFARSKIS